MGGMMAGDSHPKGHRWFAAAYDFLTAHQESHLWQKIKPDLIGRATGRVLEIGVGTGHSFPYYDWSRVEELVATDPDPFMLRRAERRAREMGLDGRVKILSRAAEDLAFEDSSFDAVISTLVLCTVRDVPLVLSEIRRVLKPDGTFRFIEHVRHDGGVGGRLQDLATPVWRWFAAGCHLNRRTAQSMAEAGFGVVVERRFTIPPGMPIIVGVAKPA
jgi:ubiquinone/menaquinone biosynthesis C-methylase UbiE